MIRRAAIAMTVLLLGTHVALSVASAQPRASQSEASDVASRTPAFVPPSIETPGNETPRISSEAESFRSLERRAILGDAHALYDLGQLYIEGNGVERDPQVGQRLLNRAINAGYVPPLSKAPSPSRPLTSVTEAAHKSAESAVATPTRQNPVTEYFELVRSKFEFDVPRLKPYVVTIFANLLFLLICAVLGFLFWVRRDYSRGMDAWWSPSDIYQRPQANTQTYSFHRARQTQYENRKARRREDNQSSQSQRVETGSSAPNDPLSVMGLGPNPTQSEIKKRYRELVKRHHPDLPGAPQRSSTRRMQDINMAYRALMSPGHGAQHSA